MLAVDFLKNKILRNWDVKSQAAKRENYRYLLRQRVVKLQNNEWENTCFLKDLELLQQQTAYGFSSEDNDLILLSLIHI